jgi:hypothetical protein
VLFINPRSGGGTAVRLSLDRRAREPGLEPVVLEPGQDLSALVADAVGRGADALGMAGGDGFLAVVAAAAGTHGLPFVCVPAGTRNHFARDLGVPRRDVEGALDAFTAGLERWIDLGEVNGRPFLDNIVLGFYGDAVRREGYRDARMRTLLVAARDALGPRAPASTAGTPPVGFELRRDRDPCGAPRRGVRRARPSGAERSSRASAASAACSGRMAQGVCSSPTLGANVDEVSAEGVDDLLDLDVALRFPVGHEGAHLRAPRADELLVRHAGDRRAVGRFPRRCQRPSTDRARSGSRSDVVPCAGS